LKIDFVTKIRKVGSEKSIFFVEWLLFTGEAKIICTKQMGRRDDLFVFKLFCPQAGLALFFPIPTCRGQG